MSILNNLTSMFGDGMSKLSRLVPGLQKTKWWRQVVTDQTKNWVLCVAILMTICSCAYSVYLIQIQATWLPIIINSGFCCLLYIISNIIMYQVYNAKLILEDEAWILLNDSVTPELHDKIRKFYEAYHETFWIRYTPPFALIIYLLIVTSSSIYIWLNLSYANSLDYFIAWLLVTVATIISIKFINDIYNLLNNFKKSKGLKELFNNNKTI